MCDDIVDELECDLLMSRLAEEYSIPILEYHLYLSSDCKHNHWHYESHKDSLASVFALVCLLDLSY